MNQRREPGDRRPAVHLPAPPPLSLPKGGGAIRGIGEKFAANPVTGSGTMRIPIGASPGRAGFGPVLELTYDSGAGNGPFGFGWTLSLPSISRKTDKGLPRYGDAGDEDVFVLGGAEDLVPALVAEDGELIPHRATRAALGAVYEVQRYRPRVEGLFARIERWSSASDPSDVFWRSISRDNVTTWYGRAPESRIFDPADPRRIFSWFICETHDNRGNVVSYGYKAEDSAGVDLAALHERNRSTASRSANRYVKRVRYGNRAPYFPDLTASPPAPLPADWCFELVFDYEEHDADDPDPVVEPHPWGRRDDPFSTYRAAFEVRTYRLCQRVLMFHHFPGEPEVGESCLVRSTDFQYSFEADPADAGNPVYAFLLSATHAGYRRLEAGGYVRRAMPPVELEYSRPIVDEQVREVDPESLRNMPSGVDEARYRWIDLDGEGIPGILTDQADRWYYKRNESPGVPADDGGATAARFGPLLVLPAQPAAATLGGAQQLLDLAGDGQVDLVELTGPSPGFYERTPSSGWAQHTPFAFLPDIEWEDPNVRFIDLTGDGHADVLITENDALCWHASLAEAGFGPTQRARKVLDEETGPRVVFADSEQSIFLADLSGDGLTDIVRVRNGEVSYWPNLGYGRFGAKVSMDRAPWFEPPGVFDPGRVRLADIDGSGTTDIVYLSSTGARLYFNQSGNSWSPAHALGQFPPTDSLKAAAVVDLLGNGTACLVWSSPLAADAHRPMRYVDLMGGQKPHLLVTARNTLGAETHVRYAPSTRFYVEDRAAGTPWITRLPFPVHVVERVDTVDRISGNRFVTRYRYRHGYFDGQEREFRGFGRVDQWDTEEIGALRPEDAPATNVDDASYVPPMVTRTWFHTGAYLEGAPISRQFESEYYVGAGLEGAEPLPLLLPDTVVPAGLTLRETIEACRALKGSMLRQEVYADDGSPRAHHPYTVSEQSFGIVRVQPHGGNRHAVFFAHLRESITAHHERNPADPRVAHLLTLAVDDFGDILRAASVGYGRRQPDLRLLAEDRDRQTRLLATCEQRDFSNAIDLADAYRAPLPTETRRHELTGLVPGSPQGLVSLDEVDEAIAQAQDIAFEATSDGSLQRRLVARDRTLYRRDDLTAALPLGQIESLALPFETHTLALTPGLLTEVFGDRVTDEMLAEGGYVHSESDPGWWATSGRSFLSPDAGDAPPQELTFARQHFFLSRRFTDPFGNPATAEYDGHDLLVVATRDALENTVQVVHDYRVLQPRLVTDPNGNQAEAAFDALGLVVGTAVMGKPGEHLGDSLAGLVADLDEATVTAHLGAPLTDPHGLLQGATTRLVYDLFAYQRTRDDAQPQPAVVYTLSRETHVSDLADGEVARVQHGFSYSDGFGREIQRKAQAEPGPVDPNGGPPVPVRWVGSGWTIFNNKGRPVRQFEPFFSQTHTFEFARQQGVSPVLFYDPAGRVVATLHPHHAWEKVIFDPWRQESWDVNDTALIEDPADDIDVGEYFGRLPPTEYLPTWHGARVSGELTPREHAAALKMGVHAGTPTVAYLDTLGRPFLTVTHDRFERAGALVEAHYPTRRELDIDGNQRTVRDAIVQAGDLLGRIVMRHDHDMLGEPIHSASMDAGERWMLPDVAGTPARAWDSRGHAFRTEYDALRRPWRQFVRGHDAQDPATEIEFGRTEYGEGEPDDVQRNLRTRPVRIFDAAGIVTSVAYDYKGNLLHGHRRLALEYRAHPDWSAAPGLEPGPLEGRTSYDALNRPATLIAPDGSVTRPEYNAGRLLERVAVTLPGAPTATTVVANIDYNAKGQRTQIEYGNGVRTSYEYDDRTFRLTRLVSARGPDVLQELSYTYDPTGNVSDLRDDAHQTIYFDNVVVEPHADYTYDAVYRLIRATGREHIGQLGPSQTSWNEAGRVRLPHPHDGQAMRRYTERYEYDGVGNLERMIHEAGAGSWTRSYAYEDASLIEPAKRSNRLTGTGVGETSEAYAHDGHGNMTAMSHLPTLAWSFGDRLGASTRQVMSQGTLSTTYYVYDASGERVRKVTESQAQVGETPVRVDERAYLGSFERYRRYTGEVATVELERVTLHVMDGTRRIAQVDTRTQGNDGSPGRSTRYQMGDHLGSACVELDDTAAVVSYEEYHPFGSTAYQAGRSLVEVSAKRYRYTGRERDDETGFNYHGARYYASWLGRWTAADRLGLIDGTNRYSYVRNNPTRRVDGSGTKGRRPLLQALVESQVAHQLAILTAESEHEREAAIADLEATNEEVRTEAARLEAKAARRAEARVKRDYQQLQSMASPDDLFEDYPAHMEPYLRDQSAGMQDDFLKFTAQANQKMARALSRTTGNIRYVTNLTMEAMGGVGEAASLANGAGRLTRLSTRTGRAVPRGGGGGDDLLRGARDLGSAATRTRSFRQEAIQELQDEFGEDVVKEYRIFFRGSSSEARIGPDALPQDVFLTEDIELAILFARRKVGRVGGEPEVSAVLITNDAFERLQKTGAVRRKGIDDMPGKSEVILSREDVRREADIYHLPYDYR